MRVWLQKEARASTNTLCSRYITVIFHWRTHKRHLISCPWASYQIRKNFHDWYHKCIYFLSLTLSSFYLFFAFGKSTARITFMSIGIFQAILNVSHNVYANDRRYADVVCCAVERWEWNTYIDVNSLWPRDAIWGQRWRSGSTLAQLMAWCLMAPSHYLNQCWLIGSMVQAHWSEGNFTRNTSAIEH